MLDQIKRKRLNLIHELGSDRPRINSSQKRKQIQANLQKFKKDVQQSKSNSPFQSANNFYPKTPYQEMKSSPTMKDLVNPFIKQPNHILIKKPEQSESLRQSPRFKQSFHLEQKQQNIQSKNINNSIQYKQLSQTSPPRNIPQTKKKIENIYDGELQNIQVNNNSIQQNQEHKLQRQVSFGNEDLQKTIQKLNTPKSVENNINNFAPSYDKKQQNGLQLNFNYNQSNYGGSSNGSSAIFFTSQFRDYLNNGKKQPEKSQQTQPIVQRDQVKNGDTQPIRDSQSRTHTDKQIGDSFLKIGDEQLSLSHSQSRTKKLLHNQSGRSLAFSNNQQSLLKQSKANEYAHYQDIVNKKLDEQLVLQISHFGKNKLKDLIEKYLLYIQDQNKIIQQFTKQFKILAKLQTLKRQSQLNLKRYYFDGFLILKEYKFNQMKNQIKADNHLKEYNQKILQKIFFYWKKLALQQEKKIINYRNQKDQKLAKNIFQVFKMIWFDYKVKRQVDLYYLSKIFSSFKNGVAKDRKRSQSTALKQYCRSLKRLYFYKLIQGTQNAKKQRLNQQLAQQHYRAASLKKFFDAWLEQCDRSPQYVSLTMTSKNIFKQTLDNKWLGIKTVDFKQLKQ